MQMSKQFVHVLRNLFQMFGKDSAGQLRLGVFHAAAVRYWLLLGLKSAEAQLD